MNDVAVRLERTTDRDIHDDLVLSLGTWQHVSDSFYFANDPTTTATKNVPQQLAGLLEQWVELVRELTPTGGTVFLPFDFSDECTGWLRVTSQDGRIARVEAGWSLIQGWSFNPSDITDMAHRVSDFAPEAGATVNCLIDDLLATITINRSAFIESSN
ncbi:MULTISPECIES: hypothetical protein [unclassified Streptomyces]|uniref:hypothetical protein n=1 Tax=unclassified Streptomyces TaxID=2593676 RepID=UPI002DDA7EBE|nr:hypothetical protein [Streptomyces sp. NBC_01445]WSE09971.1 hypothetical protein OG574_45530 [Streptomyces sp. NBC_01445]